MGYFIWVGITVGCHRYWSHRTFNAKLPLQIFLAVAQTAAGQACKLVINFMIIKYIITWSCLTNSTAFSNGPRTTGCTTSTPRRPRTPTTRGVGSGSRTWGGSSSEKIPPSGRGSTVSTSLTSTMTPSSGSSQGQEKVTQVTSCCYTFFFTYFTHYRVLEFLTVFAVPIWTLMYLFPTMSLLDALAVNSFRYMTTLHFTWLVNSAAHLYGYKKYDTRIFARENKLVALLAIGEGWSCAFINLCAYFGLAYDLKTVPHEVVMARVRRTGDDAGGHDHDEGGGGGGAWGWGTSTSRRNTTTTSRRP
ncbi:Acyl-CoA Delta(11) desaturase [Folsomia candida]|uniref:Acyl-CoA Delta(11) desaturase n=1 Tax=Folsomia candida TaxID=158441 RepID=A0A226DP64_FOLCA|nr:Acyl-CoA Delta(11) desaturase [Folsomia candida]